MHPSSYHIIHLVELENLETIILIKRYKHMKISVRLSQIITSSGRVLRGGGFCAGPSVVNGLSRLSRYTQSSTGASGVCSVTGTPWTPAAAIRK